jgi:hypothetical protein
MFRVGRNCILTLALQKVSISEIYQRTIFPKVCARKKTRKVGNKRKGGINRRVGEKTIFLSSFNADGSLNALPKRQELMIRAQLFSGICKMRLIKSSMLMAGERLSKRWHT